MYTNRGVKYIGGGVKRNFSKPPVLAKLTCYLIKLQSCTNSVTPATFYVYIITGNKLYRYTYMCTCVCLMV